MRGGRGFVAMKRDRLGQGGFTLIELMVALLIGGIVIGAIYKVFTLQRHTYYVQDQVANMQQNLRAALVMIQSDVRMAGYDPQHPDGPAACAGILAKDTGEGQLEMNMDLNGNGQCPSDTATGLTATNPNEWVTYGFSNTYDCAPGVSPNCTHDGIVDGGGVADLGRNVNNGGFQDIARNIQAIGFAYAFDADEDGQLDTSPNGHVIWALDTNGDNKWDNLDTNDDGQITAADVSTGTAITGTNTGITVNLSQIRAVRVWILARADSSDSDFTNNATYMVGRNKITVNDGYRRRLLDTVIECRNMRQ